MDQEPTTSSVAPCSVAPCSVAPCSVAGAPAPAPAPAPTPFTTFVTAFLDLREDRSKDKSFEKCFSLFSKLAATGIYIHLFLSRSFTPFGLNLPPNVHIDWIELEDLQTYKEVQQVEERIGAPIGLPGQRTSYHDTRNFMILMNAKAELLAAAAGAAENPAQTTQFAWIDFSIFHVIRDQAAAASYLLLLSQTRLRGPALYFPGCWYKGAHFDNLFNGINWRFCGGFFIGDRESILAFNALYRSTFAAVLEKERRITWEVNYWSYLESTQGGAFSPVWFQADHNDSILRVPQEHFYTVASLTTIPPRLEGPAAPAECRLAIDSLLEQVDRVYLSIAEEYPRFPGASTATPAWLSEPPYSSKVTVVRQPKDLGPAMKYLGALEEIPRGALVFFCDDDQEYAVGLISRMKRSVKELAAYQNHYGPILAKTSGGVIHGYVGNLIPVYLLRGEGSYGRLSNFPLPEAARFVDDQWMSIFCYKRWIPVLPSGVETYAEIFKVLQGGWHEKLGAASLSGLHNRDAKVREIADFFGVRFEAGGRIVEGGSSSPPSSPSKVDADTEGHQTTAL